MAKEKNRETVDVGLYVVWQMQHSGPIAPKDYV